MSLVGLPTRAPRALDQRVILVSGAHGGLGSAAAAACARAGGTVVLLGRKLPKLNRVYDAVAQAGAEPLLYPLDLEGASPDDYAELADRLRAELGHLDGVLHCAVEFKGLTPLEHTDPAAFARVMHVNLTAPWWLSQACLPLLRQAQDAALVFALDDLERVGQPPGALTASPSMVSPRWWACCMRSWPRRPFAFPPCNRVRCVPG